MNNNRWIIKIGSALLTNNGQGLDKVAIAAWVVQMAALKQQGIEVILVSSGAIAEGMQRLGWLVRPSNVHQLQAAAAVGQMGLVQTYESLFAKYKLRTAQILLTHENLTNTLRYENISATLNNLLALNVIPIINENDTVATDEITFGDNDTLAALVANFTRANKLIILTDQGGVYEQDPRKNPDARLINKIMVDDKRLNQVANRSSGSLGSGGMYTKILAARQAWQSKTQTYIVSGKAPNVLLDLAQNKIAGTHIYGSSS